jgi:hypothetical protein
LLAVLLTGQLMVQAAFTHAQVPPPLGTPPSAAQSTPQPPQFFASTFVSMHALPHLVAADVH